MPVYCELPPYFGVLCGELPVKVRIFRSPQFSDGRYQKIEWFSYYQDNSARLIDEECVPTVYKSWDIWVGSTKTRALFWRTPFTLESGVSTLPPIPIYDFQNRDIFMGVEPLILILIPVEEACGIYRVLRSLRPLELFDLVEEGTPAKDLVPRHLLTAFVKNAIHENKSCPISLTPFSEVEEFGITTCYHLFEKAALQEWLATHSTCPECRTSCKLLKY